MAGGEFVGAGRCWIAGRVIVHEDVAETRAGDDGPEDFPWVGIATGDGAQTDAVPGEGGEASVENDDDEVLLVRLVIGLGGDDFVPEVVGFFRGVQGAEIVREALLGNDGGGDDAAGGGGSGLAQGAGESLHGRVLLLGVVASEIQTWIQAAWRQVLGNHSLLMRAWYSETTRRPKSWEISRRVFPSK